MMAVAAGAGVQFSRAKSAAMRSRAGTFQRRQHGHSRSILISIVALDAAYSFDYESQREREMKRREQLKIGIVGFGNFGQFLAKR